MSEKEGKPTYLLDEELKKRLLFAIYKGSSKKIACNYAGINYDTLQIWQRKAKKIKDLLPEEREVHPYKIYYDFIREMQKVKADAAQQWLNHIDNAMKHNWQAAAWKLSKVYPKEFGNKQEEIVKDLKKQREDIEEMKSIILKTKTNDQ